MIRTLLLASVIVVGCDKRREPAQATPPVGSATTPELPDPLSLDWQSLRYDLGSLGAVKATHGRAEFHVIEDEGGGLHASQDPSATAEGASFLALDPPALVDLDGDGHEEAVIPFQLNSGHDAVFGVFVFTLRAGEPVQLGTIPTTKQPGFTIEGATIKTSEGAVWRWDAAARQLKLAP
ncbi:MAG: hypothetical protein IPQ07_24400 [Myxococcales bacterium]|nr:hypothetical protein [Myxococcales bacterium]